MALQFKKEDTPETIKMSAPTNESTNFMIKEDKPWKPILRNSSDKGRSESRDTEKSYESKTNSFGLGGRSNTPDIFKSNYRSDSRESRPVGGDDKMSVASKSTAETLDLYKPSSQQHSYGKREESRSYGRQESRSNDIFGGFEEYMNPSRTRSIQKEDNYNSYKKNDQQSHDGYSTDNSVKYKNTYGPRVSLPKRSADLNYKPVNQNFRKKELLSKLQALQSGGYDLQDSYNMDSNIQDIENEVRLGNKFLNTRSWQFMAEQGFFSLVWGIQESTKVFNPLNLKLNGLHESVSGNKEMISHEIGLIVEKYIGETGDALPPEIKLGCILCGLILFTHFSNHVAKNLADQATSGGLEGLFGSVAPMLSKMFMGGAMNPQANVPTGPAPSVPPTAGSAFNVPPPPQTSDDLNDLFSKLMPGGQSPPRQERVMPLPQSTRGVEPSTTNRTVINQPDIVSESGSEFSVETLVNNKRGRKKKKKKTLDIF